MVRGKFLPVRHDPRRALERREYLHLAGTGETQFQWSFGLLTDDIDAI
jgi:hypothetical protein